MLISLERFTVCYALIMPHIVWMIRWAGYLAHMEAKSYEFKILARKNRKGQDHLEDASVRGITMLECNSN